MNLKFDDRESSKDRVTKIHNLRVEMERIRVENNEYIKRLVNYDDWLFDSVDTINELLDKNISSDSFYDYEESDPEYSYEYDPDDHDFGEKKAKSKSLIKPKLSKASQQEINNTTKAKTAAKSKSQEKPINQQKVGNQVKPLISSSPLLPNASNTNKPASNNNLFNTSNNNNSNSTNNSNSNSKLSPLQLLCKLNPVLAAKILQPYVDAIKRAQEQMKASNNNSTTSNSTENHKSVIKNDNQNQNQNISNETSKIENDHNNGDTTEHNQESVNGTNHSISMNEYEYGNSNIDDDFDDL